LPSSFLNTPDQSDPSGGLGRRCPRDRGHFAVQFPERRPVRRAGWQAGAVAWQGMTRFRREQRLLARVTRAAWRLEQAECERVWALASARAGQVSVRDVAAAAGLSPSRVHQLTQHADLDALDGALARLREAGWPAPEDPDGDADEELEGRDAVADRLQDEVEWIRRCAGWLEHLRTESYPPAVNLRPEVDFPDRAMVVVDLARVAAILRRVAGDVDELARTRRVEDLTAAAVLPGQRAERRRRLAEPDLDFRAFIDARRLPSSSTLQLQRAWEAYQDERYRRGERAEPAAYTDNPYRPR
jgi:hypothetical protein